MTRVAFVIPGELTTPTGGYAYDRRVLALLPVQNVAVRHLALPGSFPDPSLEDLEKTFEILGACAPDEILLVDGLAYGALPAGRLKRLPNKIVALVHHPLALENGLTPQRAGELRASESAALAMADRVIAVSETTADVLIREFGTSPDKLCIAKPGTDRVERAKRAQAHDAEATPRLLAVGSIVPRKGYDHLVSALAGLKALPWTISIAGALDRSPATLAALRDQIASLDLVDRVHLTGPLDAEALDAAYATTDLFVSASLFEGYGMVLAEAMARGLPIVAATGGAAAETIPDGVAIKVPPGDADALREALHAMLADKTLRASLADAAWKAARELPTWEETARIVAAVCAEVAA